MNNWIVCGFKRAGKSTFAQQLANQLGYAYLDTDHLIAPDCREFYLKYGAADFRRIEKEVIFSLQHIQRTVIATGGGAILDPENVSFLKKLGKIIYLRVEKEELKKRIFTPPLPAFIRTEEKFEEVYAKRLPIYEQIADITIESSQLSTFAFP